MNAIWISQKSATDTARPSTERSGDQRRNQEEISDLR